MLMRQLYEETFEKGAADKDAGSLGGLYEETFGGEIEKEAELKKQAEEEYAYGQFMARGFVDGLHEDEEKEAAYKVRDPEALSAEIGRAKYGRKRFAEMAAAGRRKKGAKKS